MLQKALVEGIMKESRQSESGIDFPTRGLLQSKSQLGFSTKKSIDPQGASEIASVFSLGSHTNRDTRGAYPLKNNIRYHIPKSLLFSQSALALRLSPSNATIDPSNTSQI